MTVVYVYPVTMTYVNTVICDYQYLKVLRRAGVGWGGGLSLQFRQRSLS